VKPSAPDAERPLRAFFALPLEEPARGVLAGAAKRMWRRASQSRIVSRFSGPEKYHVTLKFLGWIPPDGVDALWRLVEPLAAAAAPLSATIAELGSFGPARRARVLVAHVHDPGQRLAALAETLERAAEALGFERESRAYRPHVTLARLSRPSDVSDWLAVADFAPVAVRFDRLCLFRSVLGPNGGEYTVLREVRLGLVP
jgi:2'-5' RNA ligase